jgi:hypothetical protein
MDGLTEVGWFQGTDCSADNALDGEIDSAFTHFVECLIFEERESRADFLQQYLGQFLVVWVLQDGVDFASDDVAFITGFLLPFVPVDVEHVTFGLTGAGVDLVAEFMRFQTTGSTTHSLSHGIIDFVHTGFLALFVAKYAEDVADAFQGLFGLLDVVRVAQHRVHFADVFVASVADLVLNASLGQRKTSEKGDDELHSFFC